jgi:hypothetical protein
VGSDFYIELIEKLHRDKGIQMCDLWQYNCSEIFADEGMENRGDHVWQMLL